MLKKIVDRYYFQLWIIIGLLFSLSLCFQPNSYFVEEKGLLFTSLYALLIALPITLVLWVIHVFLLFIISILTTGIQEKNILHILMAVWLTIGLLGFIFSVFLNSSS